MLGHDNSDTTSSTDQESVDSTASVESGSDSRPADETGDRPRRRRRAAGRPAGAPDPLASPFAAAPSAPAPAPAPAVEAPREVATRPRATVALFQAPPTTLAAPTGSTESGRGRSSASDSDPTRTEEKQRPRDREDDRDQDADDGDSKKKRNQRKRKRKKDSDKSDPAEEAGEHGAAAADAADDSDDDGEGSGSGSSRRRRRRRRSGEGDAPDSDVRESTDRGTGADQVTTVKGSTRLEAKKQRRREGREAGRRRAPILTEAEFLARREEVERVMVVRERDGRTQIAVLEDDVLVEHYVSQNTHTTMVGNVYLGRVQNVLPSMEAAFVDIGRGRNAVLYAGEVNWDAAGLEGQPKRIEQALKSGDPVIVQVTKDPVGHKGARLTSQVSLPGRYLVYVPGGSMTGISRRLPDKERARLRKILRGVVPEESGVIVRTAAENATEEQICQDVERLMGHWEVLQQKQKSQKAPSLLYQEPDLALRVVRDIFNADFEKLVVAGRGATNTIENYINDVAPELATKVSRWADNEDVFHALRIDEQLAKALDRKVWLPSGGSLVIDDTEAMTVVDVNTGKFTGQGGNLEETVTKNNLEAAEEIVRQLRLRDIGGIIVIDYIDMVLESNRDLVLRRMMECLGRDRTKHQVAEVSSLGLVQMTRKKIGQGLLEVFSEPCEACNGRGVKVSSDPVAHGQPERPPARKRPRPAGPIPGAPPGAPIPGAPIHATAPDSEGSLEADGEEPGGRAAVVADEMPLDKSPADNLTQDADLGADQSVLQKADSEPEAGADQATRVVSGIVDPAEAKRKQKLIEDLEDFEEHEADSGSPLTDPDSHDVT